MELPWFGTKTGERDGVGRLSRSSHLLLVKWLMGVNVGTLFQLHL